MKRSRNRMDLYIHHEEKSAVHQISTAIGHLLPSDTTQPVIIVCIGTDRSTGDSLGPLIGTFLLEAGLKSFHIYGTLEDPVHAVNLEEKLMHIRNNYFRPFIIGIDACLGKLASVGDIKVGSGPIKPGAGVNKNLPAVGDMHITGIVNIAGHMEFFVLQNTRLNLVMKLARQITSALIHADKNHAAWQTIQKINIQPKPKKSAK